MSMTVGQLRALLEQLPDDYTVSTEGCDCSGDVLSIAVEVGERNVHLQRTPAPLMGDRWDVFGADETVARPGPDGLEPYK